MARQCNIVSHTHRVYLGDLSDEKIDGKEIVIWKDFDFSEKTLNPETLLPNENDSSCSEEEKDDDEDEFDEEPDDKARKFLNNKSEVIGFSKSLNEKKLSINPK